MSRPAGWTLVVTAEHGGNRVPAPFRDLFAGHEALLRSHRGYDPGTLHLARRLAHELDGALVVSRVTRLIVDLNRSPDNPQVFSEVTRSLPRARRLALIERYHRPHIEAVRASVADPVASGHRVLHVGVHSFIPVLNGARRRQDLALLYDPARVRERDLAAAWIAALARARPDLRLRRNHPYRGRNDGLTTALRKSFGETEYVGIEVEVSQRHVRGDGRFPPWISRLLAHTLRDVWGAPRRPDGE